MAFQLTTYIYAVLSHHMTFPCSHACQHGFMALERCIVGNVFALCKFHTSYIRIVQNFTPHIAENVCIVQNFTPRIAENVHIVPVYRPEL